MINNWSKYKKLFNLAIFISNLILLFFLHVYFGLITVVRELKETDKFIESYSETHKDYNVNSKMCWKLYVRDIKCVEKKDETIKIP